MCIFEFDVQYPKTRFQVMLVELKGTHAVNFAKRNDQDIKKGKEKKRKKE